MIEYLDEFNHAIQYAYEKLSKNTNTAFIVTADHETGNLPHFTGTKEEINNKLYFFYASGVMAKNVWQGAYYLGSDGVMLTNAFTPDGYYVGSEGADVR